MNNAVFCDVTLCGPYKNGRFGGTYCKVLRLLTAKFVPSSPILVILMMEAIRSSERSVLIMTTQRYISEDVIPHTMICKMLIRWC
jgi:hypothetical protein